MPHPEIYWPVPQPDGLYAVHDARGPVLGYESIESAADAQAHILDLNAEAQDDAAAQDDFEADRLAEAAAECAAVLIDLTTPLPSVDAAVSAERRVVGR